MKNLGTFVAYEPAETVAPMARHLENAEGIDWYSISFDDERISKNIYVGTDNKGCVISIADNGALFFPLNMTVWEIPKNEVPENLMSDGFDANIINGEYKLDYRRVAEQKRKSLLYEANLKSELLRAELQLEIISEKDRLTLINYIEYIKKLKFLNLINIVTKSSYDSIEWPAPPE